MKLDRRTLVVLATASLAAACASSTTSTPSTPEAPLIAPAELLASLADVANGRNADLTETGLALKTIELKLLVGRETRAGARVAFVVLDADASRRSDVSFSQTFTLELPPPERRRSLAQPAALPGVAEFVEAAIQTARELADAAARGGLPQKLREVELVARIARSGRLEGGLSFTGIVPGAGVSGGAGRTTEETNTVRLVFAPR